MKSNLNKQEMKLIREFKKQNDAIDAITIALLGMSAKPKDEYYSNTLAVLIKCLEDAKHQNTSASNSILIMAKRRTMI